MILQVAEHPDDARWHWRDRRVLRARRRHDERHRQGDDLQHGRRGRRDHVVVPVRRQHGRVPEGDRPRRARRRRERGRRLPAGRPRSRARPRAVLRPCDRDRPHDAHAADQRAGFAGALALASARSGRGRAPTASRPRSRRVSIGSCTNSSYEDITRAASIARSSGRARPAHQDAAADHARLGADPGHDHPRRPARRRSKRSAASCSPTRAGRASGNGIAADMDPARRQHDRDELQPQLPQA